MVNKPHSPNRWLLTLGVSAMAAVSFSTANAGTTTPAKAPVADIFDWKENTISPVTNPIYFEDPVIRSEIRPIFIYHRFDNSFVTGRGTARAGAIQLRYAITDRLAFIATQDGYLNINGTAVKGNGWMDLAAGFKYALINDVQNQFILTPGFTFQLPTGDKKIFNGRGSGQFNPFVSFAKGFGDLHFTGNVGVLIPMLRAEQNTMAHYSLMVDYHVSDWFIPFATANFWTTLNNASNIPGLRSNGYDVINFGAGNASGVTQGMLGIGFRSNIQKNLSLGFAYEMAVVKPYGLSNNRFTMDMCIRF
ncbi:hypothetical protein [Prosthecobacter sp.]|uniref:hypothetical protein n=1 Tax=Prosthecobacter sp. TaxID=1965333 RepID=UPI003783405B